MRANKQIWRVADYLHKQFQLFPVGMRARSSNTQIIRNFYYDKAAELLKKISNNDFTDGDNHRD